MDLTHCTLCPNECGIDRHTHAGRCHMTAEARICRVALHAWEEPIISGTRGSGTIFFAGCSLSCVFCQNYEISHAAVGRLYTVNDIIRAMKELVDRGAHNINFVNPTHYAHVLKEVLTCYKPPVPVVYNTGGYDKPSTLRELDGLVDAYLPDFKYMFSETALRYSGHADYPEIAKAALDEMYRQVGPVQVIDGILQRGMIVRHLVLPGRSEEGVRVMEYLTDRYGDHIYISAMSQYTPHGNLAGCPEINRKIKPIEYKRVVAALQRAGVKNCFVQEQDSSSENYIPPFEL
ncbi:MAG: radical SAM protein [Clostridia bacterium]|nr:radical SAM protein [Clostridia bacterium]